MKVACIQMDMAFSEPEKNFEKAVSLIKKAAQSGVDTAVLPETWNTGFYPKENLAALSDDDGKKTKEVFGALAKELGPSNIRVNAIAPGFFVTKQNKDLLFNADGTPTARTDKILSATPMGRFGEAQELIGALLFLLSNEAASFVTGVVIPVDGGFSAYSGV